MADKFDKSVDNIRQIYLMIGEALDAWRIMPRIVVGLYIWWMSLITDWFISINPIFDKAGKVLIDGPTTEHTAAFMGAVGLAAGIFGFYTRSGRRWEEGIVSWKHMINLNSINNRRNHEYANQEYRHEYNSNYDDNNYNNELNDYHRPNYRGSNYRYNYYRNSRMRDPMEGINSVDSNELRESEFSGPRPAQNMDDET